MCYAAWMRYLTLISYMIFSMQAPRKIATMPIQYTNKTHKQSHGFPDKLQFYPTGIYRTDLDPFLSIILKSEESFYGAHSHTLWLLKFKSHTFPSWAKCWSSLSVSRGCCCFWWWRNVWPLLVHRSGTNGSRCPLKFSSHTTLLMLSNVTWKECLPLWKTKDLLVSVSPS